MVLTNLIKTPLTTPRVLFPPERRQDGPSDGDYLLPRDQARQPQRRRSPRQKTYGASSTNQEPALMSLPVQQRSDRSQQQQHEVKKVDRRRETNDENHKVLPKRDRRTTKDRKQCNGHPSVSESVLAQSQFFQRPPNPKTTTRQKQSRGVPAEVIVPGATIFHKKSRAIAPSSSVLTNLGKPSNHDKENQVPNTTSALVMGFNENRQFRGKLQPTRATRHTESKQTSRKIQKKSIAISSKDNTSHLKSSAEQQEVPSAEQVQATAHIATTKSQKAKSAGNLAKSTKQTSKSSSAALQASNTTLLAQARNDRNKPERLQASSRNTISGSKRPAREQLDKVHPKRRKRQQGPGMCSLATLPEPEGNSKTIKSSSGTNKNSKNSAANARRDVLEVPGEASSLLVDPPQEKKTKCTGQPGTKLTTALAADTRSSHGGKGKKPRSKKQQSTNKDTHDHAKGKKSRSKTQNFRGAQFKEAWLDQKSKDEWSDRKSCQLPMNRTRQHATVQCLSSLVVTTSNTPNPGNTGIESEGPGSNSTDTSAVAEAVSLLRENFDCAHASNQNFNDSSARTSRRRSKKPVRYSDESWKAAKEPTPEKRKTSKQKRRNRQSKCQDSPDDNGHSDGAAGQPKKAGTRNRRAPDRLCEEFIHGSDHSDAEGGQPTKAGTRNRRVPNRFCDEFLQAREGGEAAPDCRKGSKKKQKCGRRRQGYKKAYSFETISDSEVIDLCSSSDDEAIAFNICNIEVDLWSSSDDETPALSKTRRHKHPSTSKRSGKQRTTGRRAASRTRHSTGEESSIESSSRPAPPPNPIEIIRDHAFHLSGIPTTRKRKVCYDQVELATNNEALLGVEKARAPTFKQHGDQNVYYNAMPQGTLAVQRTLERVLDAGSCRYDKLEVASGTTFLRMLAHMPPITTELEESRDLPRCKNVPSNYDGALGQVSWLPQKKKRPRLSRGSKPKSNATRKTPDKIDVVWSDQDIALLKKTFAETSALSLTFWDDIAERIGGKTALECREKWDSLHSSPQKTNAKKNVAKIPTVAEEPEGDDDIFSSTPLRARTTETRLCESGNGGQEGKGFPRLDDIGSPIACKRKTVDEPTADDNGDDNLETVDFRLKPGFKRYIRTQRTDVRRSQFRKPKAKKSTKAKKSCAMISEHIGNGDVAMHGKLSPGGTLKLKNFTEEQEDDILFREDDSANEDEDDLCS